MGGENRTALGAGDFCRSSGVSPMHRGRGRVDIADVQVHGLLGVE